MADFKTILDYAPYYEGKLKLPASKSRPILTIEQATTFTEHVTADIVAKQLFDMCEKPTDFFSLHVDAKQWIPKQLQSEVFFCTKNGMYCGEISSYVTYMVRKAVNAADGIPNMVSKYLSQKDLTLMFTEGYVGGDYTLKDVISTEINAEFIPLSELRLKVRHDKFSELYVAETDMISAVPNDIADNLTDDAIRHIRVTPNGLAIGEALLRTMGGHYGITNSIYDLRELI